MTDSQRRRHARRVIDLPTRVATAASTVEARLHDVSEGGAGIEFVLGSRPLRLDIGDRVTLAPGDGAARPGRVVRLYDGGFGMAFEDGAEPPGEG